MSKRFFNKKIVRQIISIVIAVIISLTSLFGIYKCYTALKNKILMAFLITILILVTLFTLAFLIFKIYEIISNTISSNRDKKYWSIIKTKLSTEFQYVCLKTNYPEITSLIMGSDVTASIKAKIDENNEIRLIVENSNGILYDANTKNYKWFLENFSFTETKKDSLI